MVRLPVPLITPENSVSVASPVVRVPLPSVTNPDPDRDPIVGLKLFTSKVAPPATVSAVPVGKALFVPS